MRLIILVLLLLTTINAQNHIYSDEEYLNQINQDEFIENSNNSDDIKIDAKDGVYKFSDENRLKKINGGSFDEAVENNIIDIPYGSKIKAVINLSSQRLTLYANGKMIYKWKVSTGRYKFPTPRGSYKPYHLELMHYSKKYDNAPMPHSVFFKGGFAIHGTNSISRLGRKASHGCVRLHPRNAKIFYNIIQKQGKDRVSIIIK
ncbi:FIG00791721: hypothetical protein [hydrothermal vent metagenome]|uniref:L,D-TPase catalytic domain-containing protein n=1 Tax=hydrothermal vent metagenome TaxID=652676 RepID=A0A1W1EIK4_9ZZZZ